MTITPVPDFPIRIRFLGGCEFQRADQFVRLESVKTSALLAYLVLQADSQSRHKLMGLFWGDLPEEHARRNLRHALWNIRQQFDSCDFPSLLSTDSQTVRFNPAAHVWLDVAAFQQCIQRAAELTNVTQPDNCVTRLRQAMDLYRGDLLEGFYVDDAPAFDEWLLIERERLRALAIETLHRLVTYYLEWGEYADGFDYARRLLAIEPWREEAHRQMMRFLALGGQRAAALAQYETCRRILAEELSAEPSSETQALYESILATQDVGQAHPSKPASHLPMQATPFVGRETELARIAELLGEPDCRLLTLVGPGGIGKTRLAVRAAAEIEGLSDGVFFVPLAGVSSAHLVVHALATALNLTFQGGEDAHTRLLDFLRDKEMLLLLDNFEHLLPAADLLTEIIVVAPRVRFLITSRERLNIGAEWVFQVEGLDYPTPPYGPSPQGERRGVGLESYSAVKLFVQSARRARFGFVLEGKDKPGVARLCQLVEGMPLAIELAAAWTRALSCQEIAAEVEHGLDLLTTSQRDLPTRHRSLRAVFEQSWQLLTESERAASKCLAVFRGGFTRAAAAAVIGEQPAVNTESCSLNTLHCLTSLVDKSFLRHTPSGRYEIHELLRQFGEEQLSAAEADQARFRHGQYFAEWLHQYERVLSAGAQRQALDDILVEIDNVRTAWDWMTQRCCTQAIERAYTSLFCLCETRLPMREGIQFFGQGVAAMRSAEPSPENRSLLGTLLRLQARLQNMLGEQELAKLQLAEALEIALELGDKKQQAFVLNNLGILAMTTGEYVQAQQHYQASLTLKRQLGEPRAIAITLVNLAQVEALLGEYERAAAFAQEALALAQALDLKDTLASARLFQGEIALGLGNLEEARLCYETALAQFRELDKPWAMTNALVGLANVALECGAVGRARQLADEGLELAQKVGDTICVVSALNVLGRITAAMGDADAALRCHQQAIQMAQRAQLTPGVLEGLIGVAAVQAKAGQAESARLLLTDVLDHPAVCAFERRRAARLAAELVERPPRPAIAAAESPKLQECDF